MPKLERIEPGAGGPNPPAASHPRLDALVARARERAGGHPPVVGLVHPCDALAIKAAAAIHEAGIARPLLIGSPGEIARAGNAASVDTRRFELVATGARGSDAAQRAVLLAREGAVQALMKGSLHTDELMSAVVSKDAGLRTARGISISFVFVVPRYSKLLAVADCVVNIAPTLQTKCDILDDAIALLRYLGVAQPKVGIVAAVETINPAIQATLDAQALVEFSKAGKWPSAIVEGPFGFDNAISAEAARIKKIDSRVTGEADLLLMPDLNAGNILYKSFNYIGGGDCAGLVLGARVPVVLTSRADSLKTRIASTALAVLALQ